MKRLLAILLVFLTVSQAVAGTWQSSGFNQFGSPVGCGVSGNVLLSNGDCTTSWGTISQAQLPATVTLQGNTFNGALQLLQLAADASLSVSSGSVTGQLNVLNGTYSGALDTEVIQSSGTGRALNITNNGTGNSILITPKGNTSASSSTGGAFNLTNTNNTGAGAVLYSNVGATGAGPILSVTTDNAAFAQSTILATSSGTANTVTINYKGTQSAAAALNVTSTNLNFSAAQITGSATGKGVLKITHSGQSDGSDANAAGLSIDLQGTGTAAQGVFVDATTGGTTGALITLQNNGVRLGKIDKNGLFITSVSTNSAYVMWASTSATSYQVAVSTQGHLTSGNGTPVLTSCGSGSPTVVGTDVNGHITFGTAATGCTATFAIPFKARPTCTVSPETQSITNALSYTVSATALTLTEASSAGLVFDYVCIGEKE